MKNVNFWRAGILHKRAGRAAEKGSPLACPFAQPTGPSCSAACHPPFYATHQPGKKSCFSFGNTTLQPASAWPASPPFCVIPTLKTSCPVVVECNVKQQRSSSTMRHPHANLPYINNCASDVTSVDSLMANAMEEH